MKSHAWTLPVTVVLLLTLTLLWPCSANAAILTVTSCADSGPTTLRGQVLAAFAGDTILLPACTITLASPVTITTSVTLLGAGTAATAISGGGLTQVLVVNSSTVVTISGITIRDGIATDGGGIFNAGTLTLRDCVVTGNASTGVAFGGGGLFNTGTLTLLNSTVSNNTAQGEGAGIDGGGTITLVNSTVSGNMAAIAGGGITTSGALALVNSTISGNATTDPNGRGGGLINDGGVVTLLNSTVSGNTAGSVGGGGLKNTFIPLATGSIDLKNTIVAKNTAPAGGDCSGAIGSQGNNLDSDGSCGLAASGDLSGVDPTLGPLQNNGGLTATQALLPGSPAIDAGDNGLCPATDQRGVGRPQDGVCDIGAYEAAPPPSPLTISPASGVLVSTEGFDLVLTLNAPGRVVVGGQVTFDGIDIGAALAPCLRLGTLLGGGQTLRCPGLSGALLPPGVHTFTVTLTFNTGPAATDTATWMVKPNTEP